MGQFGIGQAVTRFEDLRLLRGEGRFLDDVSLPGQAHAVVVRSPHAHARIRSSTRPRSLPARVSSRSSPAPMWRVTAWARPG